MMWEIIEKGRNPRDNYRDRDYRGMRRDYNEDYRMGMKHSDYKEEIEDAYECGFEDGYKKAKMEFSDYGEKRMGR